MDVQPAAKTATIVRAQATVRQRETDTKKRGAEFGKFLFGQGLDIELLRENANAMAESDSWVRTLNQPIKPKKFDTTLGAIAKIKLETGIPAVQL